METILYAAVARSACSRQSPPFSIRFEKLRLVWSLHPRPHILHNTILQRPAPALANPNIVTLVIKPERLLNILQRRRVPMRPSDAIRLVSSE
jgi:hypothetical protein